MNTEQNAKTAYLGTGGLTELSDTQSLRKNRLLVYNGNIFKGKSIFSLLQAEVQ